MPTSFEKIKKIFNKAYESGTFAVGNLDIDNFYNINEEYGRACGDKVIEFISEILKESLPEGIVVERSGDEFFVMSTEHTAETLLMELEEVRKQIEGSELECEGYILKFTVSGAVADIPRSASSVDSLVHVLEDGLYTAKKQGRNRIIFAPVEGKQKMSLKSSYYPKSQLEKLSRLAKRLKKTESALLREALTDLLRKYSQ
ncbi:diguanylate cyclase [Kosmotoga pacifica]|uniref:Diguanylate cyclase n=1 Tax=Kosmotoga pacifica TaxID=1330330 RepID=A0A0G2Z9Q6_9BACT|nr:diguanylate cyclase [Kosmotoga pacifica]AKI96821.1 diguanylate cyclase [Kosmotoga pacifica]